jgi:hypothetical protein
MNCYYYHYYPFYYYIGIYSGNKITNSITLKINYLHVFDFGKAEKPTFDILYNTTLKLGFVVVTKRMNEWMNERMSLFIYFFNETG